MRNLRKFARRPVPANLLLAALGLTLATTGCGDLVSLHALYTEQDSVLDPALEGRWENDDNVLTVTRAGAAYNVALVSKGTPAEQQQFEMRLLDLGGVRMADILPADGSLGHMFLKVRVAAGELHFAFFDSAWLRERLPHEEVVVAKLSKQAVLIARTPELRKQVEKYVAVPQAYDDELTYRRPRK